MVLLELRQIRYFVEVAKREHVTEAANALHVAQSAVSRQIFNLEDELGVDLFIREGRNIKLTAVGKVFLNHMEQVIHVFDDAAQVVKEYTDPKRGTIYVGFPSSLANYILPTAITAFHKKYPKVKFELKQAKYDELKDSVIRGEVNIALIAPIPTEKSKLRSTILFTEKIVALLPISHRLASETSVKLNELRDESFILYPEGFTLREMVEKGCEQFDFQPKVLLETSNIESIKGFVSAGLGVSLVPEITLIENLPQATVSIPIIDPNFTRTVGIIIPTERQLLPTENLFYQFIKNFFMMLEKFQR